MFKNALIVILSILVVFFGQDSARHWFKEYADGYRISRIEKHAPEKNKIKKIIQPLQYSAIPTLLDPRNTISLDFDNQTWTFHGAHEFDDQGNVVLESGRFGLCGDLAAFTKQEITPLLSPVFDISFASVAQNGFFPSLGSTHTVLLIHLNGTSPNHPGTLILDPSFNRYGPFEQFEDYVIFRVEKTLDFVKSRNTDETFAINVQSPMVIRSNYIIALMMEKVNGKFDENNFSIALTATKRLAYSGRYLYQVYVDNGKVGKNEDKRLVKKIKLKDYERVKEKIDLTFSRHLPNMK